MQVIRKRPSRADMVVARYPVLVRSAGPLVCGLFAVGAARGPVSAFAAAVGVGFFCLTLAILAYRVEVDRSEIRVRYMPFYTKRVPTRDVTHITFDGMFIL